MSVRGDPAPAAGSDTSVTTPAPAAENDTSVTTPAPAAENDTSVTTPAPAAENDTSVTTPAPAAENDTSVTTPAPAAGSDTSVAAIEATEADFDEHIKGSPHVLVMFYASWCLPSQRMLPVFDNVTQILATHDPAVKLIKIDCADGTFDGWLDLCDDDGYHIDSVPTFKLFTDGSVKAAVERPSRYWMNATTAHGGNYEGETGVNLIVDWVDGQLNNVDGHSDKGGKGGNGLMIAAIVISLVLFASFIGACVMRYLYWVRLPGVCLRDVCSKDSARGSCMIRQPMARQEGSPSSLSTSSSRLPLQLP
ncbi:unnamed protein product [Vitrella brassicaformis CCMP3155]|uniref:Thioredoxin domain-containing protein n=1 Tax=Vitrella brassicaformis (strain CCMP3155) TaxID=1169540 RepID=A0A0G4EBP6_VITBC|nr:unnamed protein product [Vitrella brassicaformis CCMP3155]|eukprot:CEL92718.1 unnamed protein product [Vitrella brassicaformis CCMP3155]